MIKTSEHSTHVHQNVVEKGDEEIMTADNILKDLKKDIPIGADLIYVSVAHIIDDEGHHGEGTNDNFVLYGLTLSVILMCLCIGVYQYLIISQKNKWYYNAIYTCDCDHCSKKKNISSCDLKIPKHKFLGVLSGVLHIISFISFVYFHGQPFQFYGLYDKSLSFLFLIIWSFLNGIIHKVVKINVPKYIHINMKRIRMLKNRKKELLAAQYKKKIEKRYNGMVQKHIEYIENKVTHNDDCFCEYDLDNVTFKELERDIKESDAEEEEELLEIEKEIKILTNKENITHKKIEIVIDETNKETEKINDEIEDINNEDVEEQINDT